MKPITNSLGAGLLFVALHAHAATESWAPFSVVEVTTDAWQVRNGLDDVVVYPFERQVAEHFAEAGSEPALYAKGRSIFGESGVYAIATGQPANYGAYSEAGWSEAFTVLGKSGSGVLDVKVRVVGHFSGLETNAHYQLFVSNTPITLGEEGGAGFLGFSDNGSLDGPDGSSKVISGYGLSPVTMGRLSFAELAELQTRPLNNGTNLYSAQIPFTYGVPVYIASYLGVEALGDGVGDFFSSAYFGISAPDDATLINASGTTYLPASAVVPIPGAIWLFGSVIFGFNLREFRKRVPMILREI